MLANLKASFVIWISNVTASFGFWINLAVVLFIAGLVIRVVVKSAIVRRDMKRRSPLMEYEVDEAMTRKASARLAGMLRFPTVTGEGEPLRAQCDYIKATYSHTLNRLGYLELPNGSMLLRWKAKERSDDLPVLFCGHLDVVPAGEGWTRQPFGGVISDGRIFGRGAYDSKGGVIAMLEAVEGLLAQGFAPKRDIYFAFGHDEETGGENGAGQIAQLLARRNLTFEMIVDEGGYIVENFMDKEDCTAALIGIAEKTACTYRVTVRAQGGDSSIPPKNTTVGMLSEAVCRIEASQPRMRLLPATKEYLEKSFPAMSFGKRLAVSNMFLTKPFLPLIFRRDLGILAMLRSTLAPTIVSGAGAENVIPTEVSATINARLVPGESPEGILEYMRGLLADLPAEVELVKTGESVKVTDTAHPMYQMLCRALDEKYSRLPCIPVMLSGSTDSRHYIEMTDCVLRFTPFILSVANASTAHGPDEYICEKTLGLGIEFYKSFMRKL